MLSDDDVLDIYDDLDEFQNAEEKKSKELQALEIKFKGAQAEIEGFKAENKALSKKIRVMEVNLQNLMDTAKAELKRKESMITQLRKEKDDMCFRRKRGRADEDPRDAGHEHKRSKLSEPAINKFKTALGNDSQNTNHENERPKLAAPVTNKFKTVVAPEAKNSEHKRQNLLAEPAINKFKTESKEPRKHKLEETMANRFRTEPKTSDKMSHQMSSTGGESMLHENKDSKRTNRSRSPTREDRHKSTDRHRSLKERERRRSRSRSAKRSHRHGHHRSRKSKDRSSKRRSVSRSPNRTGASKQSARHADNERSKGAQKEAKVTRLFGEETSEIIKKMQANMSPATPVELYTPEHHVPAPICGDKPAKNEEISISAIDGYFQVNPQAIECSLPAVEAAPETLEEAEPTAGVFSWGSSMANQQIPGLDMICQQHSLIKNATEAQPEDVNLGTPRIDALEDCIIDHTEEVITLPTEDCKPTESMEQKQESLSLEPEAMPEAPGSPMDIEICETPSKDEDNSVGIETPSVNITPKSEEKEGTLIPKDIEATAQIDDRKSEIAGPEIMEDAIEQATVEVTLNPPALEYFKTPTKCKDTLLGDDCPTPMRPREITENQAVEEITNPTISDVDCPTARHASQISEAIEIIEDIRLPVIVDIENIALTVDVPFDLSDVNLETQDLNVVDGKNDNKAELAKKENCVLEDMEIEQDTFEDETTADRLGEERPLIETPVIAAQGSENEMPVAETSLSETPLSETPVIEPLVTETPDVEPLPRATHELENATPKAETTVIETAATQTMMEAAAMDETPSMETPVMHETPSTETPAMDETPLMETPHMHETPSTETPITESPETFVTEMPLAMETSVVENEETCAMETAVTELPVAAVHETNNENPAVETATLEMPAIETLVTERNVSFGETPAFETLATEIPFMEHTPPAAVYESRIEFPLNETGAIKSTGIEIPTLPPHGSIHDTLIVAATSKPSSVLYAQPDSTKTDHSEDMVLEAAMNELTGEQEPVPSAGNTSYPNLTLAEDTIEMALQQLHQTSPDETKVTSTSNKSQKSPQKDLSPILTESPVQLSPAKTPPKGKKTTPMTTPEKLKVEKTPLKKRKIHMPEDEVLVPQTPPPAQPPIAPGSESSPTLQHVTIDETLNESLNRSFGSDTSSVVTKRCSMGSTDYQFERINDEIVLRVSRRKRRRRPTPAPLDDGEKSAGT